MKLKIVYMGTPQFAVGTLEALHKEKYRIVAAYTMPPKPAGKRGLKITESPVQKKAKELGIPVYQPDNLDSTQVKKEFEKHQCDVAVVVAYGRIIPKEILEMPKYGCFNGHASLLPRWRGAAPIQRAIMAGDTKTGISVMKMNEELDTGPVGLTRAIDIQQNDDGEKIQRELAQLCASVMVEAMGELENNQMILKEQEIHGICYAHKISKKEKKIEWGDSALNVHRKIMGLGASGGAWCEIGNGERLKIFKSEICETETKGAGEVGEGFVVGCGEGAVKITEVQKQGGRRMAVEQFLAGNTMPEKMM